MMEPVPPENPNRAIPRVIPSPDIMRPTVHIHRGDVIRPLPGIDYHRGPVGKTELALAQGKKQRNYWFLGDRTYGEFLEGMALKRLPLTVVSPGESNLRAACKHLIYLML
jgi:hypothetical protein